MDSRHEDDDERTAQPRAEAGVRAAPSAEVAETLSPPIELSHGRSVRIDAAHPHDSAALRFDQDRSPETQVPDESQQSASPTGWTRPELERAAEPLTPEEMLEQVQQISARLQRQATDLGRREHRLHQQLASLEHQSRATRLYQSEFEEERTACLRSLETREADLLARAADLASAQQEQQAAVQDLARRHQDLEEAQAAWRIHQEVARCELEAERDEVRATIEAEREALLAEVAALRVEAEADRRQAASELQAARESLRLDREHLDGEFRQERVLLENRLRFQQEHLDRTRDELEQQQTEFRREQQSGRVWLEEQQAQVRRLRNQLDERHRLLDEREASLAREQELFIKSRRALESGIASDRDQLEGDREQFERERDMQRADLRRQQDLLAIHAETLDARRNRLDQLRAELEETNRKTLETRVAVEEAYGRLATASGPEVAKARVEEARAVLAEYYRHTRDALIQHRLEIDQAQQRLFHQRQELDSDREGLAAWGVEQEQLVARREQLLEQLRTEVDQREQEARTLRERWLEERSEAEAVIRDLLNQLEARALAVGEA
jgi:hypothetical protein